MTSGADLSFSMGTTVTRFRLENNLFNILCSISYLLHWWLLSRPSLHKTNCFVLTFGPQAINNKTIQCQAKQSKKTLKQKRWYHALRIPFYFWPSCSFFFIETYVEITDVKYI